MMGDSNCNFLNDTLEGFTTKEALDHLQREINDALEDYEACLRKEKSSYFRVLCDALSHRSYLTSIRWTSVLVFFLCGIFLLSAYASKEYTRFATIPLEVTIIFGIGLLSVCVTLWDIHLRFNELSNLTRRSIIMLRDLISYVYWESHNYPHLHSPLSPCITLQWTKRDGAIVNLPWPLLVKGDIILLRPGQKVPGKCRLLDFTDTMKEDLLYYGDIYSPYLEGVGEGFTSPKARTPLHEAPYKLLETPYLIKLRILFTEALNRPTTIFNKQCHWLFANGIEFFLLPILVTFVIAINVMRVNYDIWVGHWTEALLVLPSIIALPLVPLVMPLANILLNWFGTASILAMFHHAKAMQNFPSCDPFEGQEIILCNEKIKASWKDIKVEFVKVITGTQAVPTRTSNLLHVLASVTNLCCVDKKGILSWPNPTAEKLFFLRNRGNHLNSRLNLFSSDPPSDTEGEDHMPNLANSKCYSSKESESVVMSLTHDNLTPFGLQFDDVSWKKYLLSLKPLGLNILLNTCNPATQSHYTKFCSHITCEAMYNEDLVPVSQRSSSADCLSKPEIFIANRGCLCELPKQMGFRSRAQDPFELEHQLCTFRHVPFDMACKDRLARSLSITKLKFPFPHMVSVLMRDKYSGKLELMSQGTADIILDSCTDYWDGCDISHITEKDRKKIIDFYHRSSLSAYCTAFAYRPTTCTIKEKLSNFYLELPVDPSHLYHTARTPTPHISTDALYGDTEHTEYEEIGDVEDSYRLQNKQIFIGMVTMQYQAQSDMVRLIEELEEACIRFVHFSKENELRSRVFSEKMGLECGWNCHISLLSDRTARTESGNSSHAGNTSAKTSGLTLYQQSNEDLNSTDQNRGKGRCHGFYRSKSLRRKFGGVRTGFDVGRALSHSAPSAINLDVAQVKFDEDISICSKSLSANSSKFSSVCNEEQGFDGSSWPSRGIKNKGLVILNNDCSNEEQQHLTSNEGIIFPDQDLPIYPGFCSQSSLSSSSSEPSESLNLFDMSNRARLPKGIENIRPHLENVDNVPLLVSLFTDCTMPVTKAMLVIMQEYTEVVILMGSTANAENMDLFMQADLSIGIDPLHPQVCMREPVFICSAPDCGPPPMEVAGILNSLPCSLSFHREDRISLVHLILKARHFMQHFMSCLQFWACCNASVSILQFISATALLPPVLSSGDVLWMICVPIPILSISLSFAPTNPAVMEEATGKNKVPINKETLKYIWLYYACKFVPSILVVVITTIWTFSAFCQHIAQFNDGTCDYVYPTPVGNSSSSEYSWGGWGEELAHSQNVIHKTISFQLILYFSVISISFVHRKYQLWKRNPLSNRVWVGSTITILIIQIIYIKISLSITYNKEEFNPGIWSIPLPVWFILFSWPLLLLLINEFIKRREIRVNVRYQKRAKLEFGTKLGMNSPF